MTTMTQQEIATKIFEIQRMVDASAVVAQRLGENHRVSALCQAFYALQPAIDAAEFPANHYDGWAKWVRVCDLLTRVAIDLEPFDSGMAAIIFAKAKEIAPEGYTPDGVFDNWGEKADRLEQSYPHQN